jgi:transcriptional regulator with XRE-family HTH domain
MMTKKTTTSAKRPNSTDAYVGSRVRMRRKMLGMSQEKLGEQLGITFQQVQKYEKGANRVGASRLQTISQVLEMPISYFFPQQPAAAGGMGESAQSDYISDFMMSSEGIELNRAFAQIKDPKLRRKVIDLVRTMATSEAT